MVTIVAITNRTSKEGKAFISLDLQGDVELIQSSTTGKFYATSKKCSIPSTFSEEIAKTLIGKQVSGSIIRQECEPYEYTVPSTGEIITLAHTYSYQPEVPAVKQTMARQGSLSGGN